MPRVWLIAVWSVVTLCVAGLAYFLEVRTYPVPRVNVRWSPDVDAGARARLEAEFHLDHGESRDVRTWSYQLSDASTANVRALVAHTGVEDTHGIDRGLFLVESAPDRWQIFWFALLVACSISAATFTGIKLSHRLFGMAGRGWRRVSTWLDSRPAWAGQDAEAGQTPAAGSMTQGTLVTWLALGVAAVVVLGDRYYWAQVSQWREDQATHIWLGYTQGLGDIPVGLMSSKGIPNPNGMIVVSFVMSVLPSLFAVGFALSVVQVIWVVLLGRQAFATQGRYLVFATVPALSSVVLRSTSVELWNNYVFVSVNTAFLFWMLRYLQYRSLWSLPPVVLLVFLAPSLYLAGLVNAVVMALLTVGVLVCAPPRSGGLRPFGLVVAGIALLSVSLTWWPYFRSVSVEEFTSYGTTRMTLPFVAQTAWLAIVKWPRYGVLHWVDASFLESAIKHADPRILAPSTRRLLWLAGRLYLIQSVFAAVVFGYASCLALLNRGRRGMVTLQVNRPVLRVTALAALFVIVSYACGALLSGPAWMVGERPDQTVQYLPAFLLIVFLSPFVVSMGGVAERLITGLAHGILVAFATVSLICGFMTIRDHLSYRGSALTEADVPLTDKEQVVGFIAASWKSHSVSSSVPVDYDLGGGVWDWVPAFGQELQRWYRAPMTEGRAFDYELLRRHGLTNQQEGVQLRTFGSGRYLVTYAFQEAPTPAGAHVHHVFGRLRVTVVDR